MSFESEGEPEFWRLYGELPSEVKALARKNYRLWRENPFHPSLRFKAIAKPNWSVRIGDHYRAVGLFHGNVFLWQWIGTHEAFNTRY